MLGQVTFREEVPLAYLPGHAVRVRMTGEGAGRQQARQAGRLVQPQVCMAPTLLRCWWVCAVVAELDMRPDTWHRPAPIADKHDAELLGPASR